MVGSRWGIVASSWGISKGLLAAGVLAAPALATAQVVDLSVLSNGFGGFAVNNVESGDFLGSALSAAGDVNADGVDDFLVAARLGDGAGTSSGQVFVVFGRTGTSPVGVSAIAAGTGGFVINGAATSDQAGWVARCAGDVNGDGFSDIVIGAPYADPATGADAGRAYVVFGKQTTTAVNLSALGAGGIEFFGPGVNARAGTAVDGAGDVNGDGFADLVIGAPYPTILSSSTVNDRVYFVFGGSALPASTNLTAIGASVPGFVFQEATGEDRIGDAVAGIGDFNGDGLSDIVVGAPTIAAFPENEGPGGAWVVLGKTSQTPVVTSDIALGNGGIKYFDNGSASGASGGRAVAPAGDVNADGLADFLWSIPTATFIVNNAGRTFVVHGRTTTSSAINTSALLNGIGGFVINGDPVSAPETGESSGESLAGAGDVNGDGLSDFLIGAPLTDAGGGADRGGAYLLFGRTATTTVQLSALKTGIGAYFFRGAGNGDQAGLSVAGVGDINGDGMADVAIGAPLADTAGLLESGRAYVFYSPFEPPTSTTTYNVRVAPGNAPRMGYGVGTGAPDDGPTPASRFWLDYTTGSAAGVASTSFAALTRNKAIVNNLGESSRLANVVWQISNGNRAGGGTHTFTFRYTNEEIAGLNEMGLKLYRSTSGANGPWTLMPASLDTARNQFTLLAANFGHFAIADLDAPTAAIYPLDSNPYAGHLPRYGVSFSEPVGDTFTIDDLLLGTTSGFVVFPQLLSVSGTDPNYIVKVMAPPPIAPGIGLTMFLEAGSVTDKAGNPLASQVQAPWYTLYPPPAAQGPGDINKDGAVNVADVTALADHIVNGTPLP